jgi:hypothetical protein
VTPEVERLSAPCIGGPAKVGCLAGRIHRKLHRLALRLISCFLLAFAPACQFASAQNRVLELDGNGSYVELPPDIFTNLTEATVEVWARWSSFRTYSRVFDFGAAYQSMSVFNHANTPDLRFNLYPRNARNDQSLLYHIRVNGSLVANEWMHLAAISGPGGMKLYVNGELVGLHTNAASFADIKVSHTNLFGRGTTRNPGDQDFHGQMDEIRVWDHRRTESQIRENMRKQLTGKETGLSGLWNFDDGTARDTSTQGNHGKLIGNARAVALDPLTASKLVVPEALPTVAPNPVTPLPNTLAAVPANGRDTATWWIAGSLTLIVALLAWLVLMLRRNVGAPKLLPAASSPALTAGSGTLASAEASSGHDLKERALAELTEFAKESLVQGLFEQRKTLLETHQKAQQELAALESRLVSLHLSDRVQAYEKRIAELEKELESRSGEVRELTAATLLLLRKKLEEEKQLEGKPSRLN